MSKSIPKYSHHKASDRAYVFLEGKRVYLGKHGSPESHRAYTAELAKWQATQEHATANASVKQLTLMFFEHCAVHYRKNGELTSEYELMRLSLRHVNRRYKDTPADKFTPMMLAIIRQGMVDSGDYCRKTINGYVKRIVQCFKWGVSKGLVSVATWQALTSLEGLKAGRTEVRESEPVQPVSLADVEAVKPYVSPSIWGAIQFQLATAARPGEALTLRLAEIDRSGEVWIYRPGSHKTEHHGKGRLILIGPRAQALIMECQTYGPRMEGGEDILRIREHQQDPDAYVFAVLGTRGKKSYRRDTYTNAIKRACEIAFNMPVELRRLKKNAPEELKQEAALWRAKHCWAPNQLRHTAATEIRKAAGTVEAAKTILGHSELRTTEIYAERDLAAAAEIIKKIG